MHSLQLALKYLNYRLHASTEHDVHSPFVYAFVDQLLKPAAHTRHYDFEGLDAVRQQLLNNGQILSITDFGAGSRVFKSNERVVKDIAAHGISRRAYAELLYRLVNRFQPNTIVELGTSLGLTTLYLAKPRKQAQVYTLEGSPSLVAFARPLFEAEQAANIRVIEGNFDDQFPKILEQLTTLDFLYVDGNHAQAPTLRYFEMALQKKQEHSVFVFDDIHWNNEMEAAWNQIRRHPDVSLSFDLFFVGIVFFRKAQFQQEHFTLAYWAHTHGIRPDAVRRVQSYLCGSVSGRALHSPVYNTYGGSGGFCLR